MRIVKKENKNGTWSLYDQTNKRFLIENGTKEEVDKLKKLIDWKRRNGNQLRNGG